MPYKVIGLLIGCIIFSSMSSADEKCHETGLSFDSNTPEADGLIFKDEDHQWLPRASDFELLNYHLMSNACGERWALVTIKNLSPGTSSFSGENIIALMADGSKTRGNVEKRIEGRATESFTIRFGISKVPIIKLYVKRK